MEIEQILDFAGVDVDGSDFDWGYEAVLRSYNTLETLISYPGSQAGHPVLKIILATVATSTSCTIFLIQTVCPTQIHVYVGTSPQELLLIARGHRNSGLATGSRRGRTKTGADAGLGCASKGLTLVFQTLALWYLGTTSEFPPVYT
eukprot:1298692-Rhodomonas_salina.1